MAPPTIFQENSLSRGSKQAKSAFRTALEGWSSQVEVFLPPQAKGSGTSQFLTRIWAVCLRPEEYDGIGGNWTVFAMRVEVSKQFIFMSLARQGPIRIISYGSLCRLAD